jgi:hypothetical protein
VRFRFDLMSGKALERLNAVNAVLRKLANDEDLQDDFKEPAVQAAINHWTGKNRLDPDKAQHLQNHRRVMYVFQRFQMLQAVCKDALMPVPLDHLLNKKIELDLAVVRQYLPQALSKPEPVPSHVTKIAKESVDGLKANGLAQAPVKSVDAAPPISPQTNARTASQSLRPDTSGKSEGGLKQASAVPAATDVNTILKVAIAVIFCLIAVVVSLLIKR